MSTLGDVQYIGGYHEYIGGYHEYIGGCFVHWGYQAKPPNLLIWKCPWGDTMSTLSTLRDVQYIGEYHQYIGDIMSTSGDIMSTSGDVQYIRVFNKN